MLLYKISDQTVYSFYFDTISKKTLRKIFRKFKQYQTLEPYKNTLDPYHPQMTFIFPDTYPRAI
jgi:hypothetical protein